MICIVSYVTWSFIKCVIAQKSLENRNQAFSSSEVTVESDNSKNLFANNKSNSYKELINAKSLSNTESDISVIYSFKAMRKTSYKCK